MFRSTLLRRMVVALCMALMMGGVVSVGEIVTGDDARVPLAFALHADVHVRNARTTVAAETREIGRSANGVRPAVAVAAAADVASGAGLGGCSSYASSFQRIAGPGSADDAV